jgi:hypothetical protein
MTDSMIVFSYRFFVGAVACLVVSLFWAKRVSTQQTINRDVMGSGQVVTTHVDHRQFLRTWGLYTACLSATWLAVLVAIQTHHWMRENGYIS